VLFEATPNGPIKASAAAANVGAAADCDIEAARAALRQSLEETLGSGVREFALQVEALREVLPDATQRQRAALRVLSLKGIEPQTLVAELEQTITRLSQQRDAFSSKLSARQSAIEQQRHHAIEACRVETAETEQAIDRLQSELEAARAQLSDAGARRLQTLGECDEHAARLAQKQRSFEHAFADLHGEYATLQRQLTTPESV
jgi:chromosome segregation ATPase